MQYRQASRCQGRWQGRRQAHRATFVPPETAVDHDRYLRNSLDQAGGYGLNSLDQPDGQWLAHRKIRDTNGFTLRLQHASRISSDWISGVSNIQIFDRPITARHLAAATTVTRADGTLKLAARRFAQTIRLRAVHGPRTAQNRN